MRLTVSQLHGLFFFIIAQKVRKDDCYFGNVLKCGKECDIIQVLHNHIMDKSENVFLSFGKNALSILAFSDFIHLSMIV